MSELTDYLKRRVFIAMPDQMTTEKKRLARLMRQSFDILEQTRSGRLLLSRLPDFVCFCARQTLNKRYGMYSESKKMILLAGDSIASLLTAVPVLAHECAHVLHLDQTRHFRSNDRSVFERFMFFYLDEVGARLVERDIVRACVNKKLLSYTQSFFEDKPNFYRPQTGLKEICADVDQSYLKDFLQIGAQSGDLGGNPTYLKQMKQYYQKLYPCLDEKVFAHARYAFNRSVMLHLTEQKPNRFTRCEKLLLYGSVPPRIRRLIEQQKQNGRA